MVHAAQFMQLLQCKILNVFLNCGPQKPEAELKYIMRSIESYSSENSSFQ